MSPVGLADWTERLTGLPPDWVADAQERIRGWNIDHVTRELVDRPDVDAMVGATLLCQAFDELTKHVDGGQLRRKLKGDRGIWSTWAELCAAHLILKGCDADTELRLEPGRSAGAHPDLQLILPNDAAAQSIEVKAIGLSDQEVAFFRRQSRALQRMIPREGIVTLHAPLEGAEETPEQG